MSTIRPAKSSRQSSKFQSPKSFQSLNERFRFTEENEESEDEEVRGAFSSLTIDLQKMMNELNMLKIENSALKEQLKQAGSEKNNLSGQFNQSKEALEREIIELKATLIQEEEARKKLINESYSQKMELEGRINQMLNEKMISEKAYKKAMDKNKVSFKKVLEEKDAKINKLLKALNSVKKIETQVKSMLTKSETHTAQSAGHLPFGLESRHMKSSSYMPYE